MSEKYQLTVINNSGDSQRIAIYQTLPGSSSSQALSLVWMAHNINNKNEYNFTWEVNWALNWGTSEQPLEAGIAYTSQGEPETVMPNNSTGPNCMAISYEHDDFTHTAASHSNKVPLGSMLITTNSSFTVAQARCMNVSVYMNGVPALAMQGKPNGNYRFDTHPTYYLCVTDQAKGVAVDGSFVTNPTAIRFEGGATNLVYTLNQSLEFIPGKQSVTANA